MTPNITNGRLIQMQIRALDNVSPQTPASSTSSASVLSKWSIGDKFTNLSRSRSTVDLIAKKYDATDGSMPSLLEDTRKRIDRLGN